MMFVYRSATVEYVACLLLAFALPSSAADPTQAGNEVVIESAGPHINGLGVPLSRGQDSWLVMGSEFVGQSSKFIPARNGSASELACVAGSIESQAIGRLAVPDGVLLNSIDIWRYDNSALENMRVSILRKCMPSDAPDTPNTLQIRPFSISYPGQTGGYAASSHPISISVDALQCSYYAQVDFGTGCTAGQDLRLVGVRVNWGTN